MSTSRLDEVAENWLAERLVTPEGLGFLRKAHKENLSIGGDVDPDTADGSFCASVDIPRGSSWGEAIAALLDTVEPGTGGKRLRQVRKAWGLPTSA